MSGDEDTITCGYFVAFIGCTLMYTWLSSATEVVQRQPCDWCESGCGHLAEANGQLMASHFKDSFFFKGFLSGWVAGLARLFSVPLLGMGRFAGFIGFYGQE